MVTLSGLVDALGDAVCGGVIFVYYLEFLGGGSIEFGWVRTSLSISKVLGQWIMGVLVDSTDLNYVLRLSLLGSLLGYVLIGSVASVSELIAAIWIAGVFDSSGVIFARIVANNIAQPKRASVFSVFSSCSSLAFAIVPVLGAVAAQGVSIRAPYFFMASLTAIVFLASWTVRYTETRDKDTETLVGKPYNLGLVLLLEMTFCASATFNNVTRAFLLKDILHFDIVQSAAVLSTEGALDGMIGLVTSCLLTRIRQDRVFMWTPGFMIASALLRIAIVSMRSAAAVPLFILSILFDCISGNVTCAVLDSLRVSIVSLHHIGRFRALVKTAVLGSDVLGCLLGTYVYRIDPRLPYALAVLSSVLGAGAGYFFPASTSNAQPRLREPPATVSETHGPGGQR